MFFLVTYSEAADGLDPAILSEITIFGLLDKSAECCCFSLYPLGDALFTTVNSLSVIASARSGLVIYVYLFLRYTATGRRYIEKKPPKAPEYVSIMPIFGARREKSNGIAVMKIFTRNKSLFLTCLFL